MRATDARAAETAALPGRRSPGRWHTAWEEASAPRFPGFQPRVAQRDRQSQRRVGPIRRDPHRPGPDLRSRATAKGGCPGKPAARRAAATAKFHFLDGRFPIWDKCAWAIVRETVECKRSPSAARFGITIIFADAKGKSAAARILTPISHY